jgi:hypothetical protein
MSNQGCRYAYEHICDFQSRLSNVYTAMIWIQEVSDAFRFSILTDLLILDAP